MVCDSPNKKPGLYLVFVDVLPSFLHLYVYVCMSEFGSLCTVLYHRITTEKTNNKIFNSIISKDNSPGLRVAITT